jgi:hypothetical protein
VDNLETVAIGFVVLMIVLGIVASIINHQTYLRRQEALDRLEKAQPHPDQLPPSHPLRLMLAEIEREQRRFPAPSYPISTGAIVGILLVLLLVVPSVLAYVNFSNSDSFDQVVDGLNRLNDDLVRRFEDFLRMREMPYRDIQQLDSVLPIVIAIAAFIVGPILLWLIVWLMVRLTRTLWRALTWRSAEGYILEVDSHSEIKVVRTSKGSSRSYYHATRLAALYRDEDNVPQVAYSRAEGWRAAHRAAQQYRVGQRVALRLSRNGRYALFGRVLDDERGIGSSPLVTRM